MGVKSYLQTPWIYNPEYIEEMQDHHNRDDNVIRLNELNLKIWELYQLTSSYYSQRNPNYFNFVLSSLFSELDDFESYYIIIALPRLDEIVKEHKIREQEREAYKQAIKQDLKRK